MSSIFEKTLFGWRNNGRDKAQKGNRQDQAAAILATIERVVDGTDARIRLVSGYKKKLQPVIADALDYTDSLVTQIPAAIEVSNTTFVTNPYVNAFFSTPSDLQTVFSRSSELRDFLESYENRELTQSCALLCMQKTEKTVMGMELSGDLLRRDVRQIAVNFSDHRIYSPTPNEEQTRAGLRQCLFDGLVTNALERIMELKMSSHRLQAERQMLRSRLRQSQFSVDEQTVQKKPDTGTSGDLEEIRRKLEQTEKDLEHIHSASPQVSLEQVAEVFANARTFVRLNRSMLRINKMGIKIGEDSKEPCNEIDLTEATISGMVTRVITLANFPRDDLLPKQGLSKRQAASSLHV